MSLIYIMHVVLMWASWSCTSNRGVTVAAEVGGERAEPAGGERGHLVAPGEPELREAMEEKHRRPIRGALLGDVDGHAVDVGVPVPHLAGVHGWLLCSTRRSCLLRLLRRSVNALTVHVRTKETAKDLRIFCLTSNEINISNILNKFS